MATPSSPDTDKAFIKLKCKKCEYDKPHVVIGIHGITRCFTLTVKCRNCGVKEDFILSLYGKTSPEILENFEIMAFAGLAPYIKGGKTR